MSKLSEKTPNWSVIGIQHAISKRILPHLIHDIASPLSVALLQAGIIKRKLKTENPSIKDMLQHANDLDIHLRRGVVMIRALKEWDNETEHFFSPATIFQQSVKFFRTKLALRGIELELMEAEAEPAEVSDFQALVYCWLALLCYLEEALQAAYRVEVTTGVNAVTVQWQKKKQGIPSSAAASVYDETIGRQELIMLSDYYETSIEFTAESIIFKW